MGEGSIEMTEFALHLNDTLHLLDDYTDNGPGDAGWTTMPKSAIAEN